MSGWKRRINAFVSWNGKRRSLGRSSKLSMPGNSKPNRKPGGRRDDQSASSAAGGGAEEARGSGWSSGVEKTRPGAYQPDRPRARAGKMPPLPIRRPEADGRIDEHIQEDIVVKPQAVVTRYLHASAYCPKCRRAVVQTAKDEIPHAPIGPVAKSTAVYLRYRVGIPYRKTREILTDLFGLTCVPASLVGFDHKAAKNGTAIYEDLRERSGRRTWSTRMRPHGAATG